MPQARKLQTNFSAGELSPRLEGRPDLAKFFNGASILENYLIYPQGGIYDGPRTRFVDEVKDSSQIVRLIPFVRDHSQPYYLEFGNLYVRFYQGRSRIEVAGVPVEVSTPYTTADLPDLAFEQSVDVLFINHPSYQTRKLNHFSSTNWTLTTLLYRPPPSQVKDTDISGGTITLTPGATTGTGITFTASAACFLEGDVDREIIYGNSRAVIDTFTDTTHVVADIIEAFPSTAAIPAGEWFLRGSPSPYINPTKKKLRSKVTINSEDDSGTNKDAFRAADVGKFIKTWGGIIEITKYTNAHSVSGIIKVSLSIWTGKSDGSAMNNPDRTPLWSLEEAIWTAAEGYPTTLGFYQDRLFHAIDTTFIGSATDDFENYGVGAEADSAVQYTILSRQLNQIVWIADLGPLFLGTPGGIYMAKASGVDNPLGGDSIPLVRAQNCEGSLAMRPAIIGTAAIYVDVSGKRVYDLTYSFDDNNYRSLDLTKLSEHITGTGIKADNIAYVAVPNRHLFFVRNDGQLLALTYFRTPEDVVGWSRLTTDGAFENVCAVPHVDGDRDMAACVVRRTINGVTKRYIEIFEDDAPEMAGRAWTHALTDCAYFRTGSPITTLTGLDHLEAKTVDVVADGSYKGQYVVTGGAVTIEDEASQWEVGLHVEGTLTTMRPAVQDAIIEGMPRKWINTFLRVHDTVGAEINGEDVLFNLGGQPMDAAPALFTGDKKIITSGGWSTEGKITIKRTQPYPQEILALFGDLQIGARA